ncbi:MAG: YqaJ viral recombinase family protein [Syntrophaceae bacterium]
MDIKDRQSFLGGSDIASVFNIGYGCARRLWYEKTGVEPDYPKDTFHLRRGNILEPVAAMLYAQETGKKIRKRNLRLIDEERPYLTALLDREVVKDERGPGVLEIKCPGLRGYLDVKRKGAMDDYVLQLQMYMWLRKANFGAFCFFSAELAEIFHFEVLPDEELIAKVLEGAAAFWQLVQNRTIPDKLDKKDKRCLKCTHGTTCQGITNEEYLAFANTAEGLEIVLDDELDRYVNEYWDVKAVKDEADEMMDGVKEKIKMRMEAIKSAKVQIGNSKVHYTDVTSNRWDTRKLALVHPELEKEFKKPSVSKRLALYRVK